MLLVIKNVQGRVWARTMWIVSHADQDNVRASVFTLSLRENVFQNVQDLSYMLTQPLEPVSDVMKSVQEAVLAP